uniref:RIN4 pathogenic type III effector avirulence factor Avr cleavage site domain-containing protein n=1 Tax=Aegilops tauschii TaxID=37682 RepID=M8BHU3_AEGTA
MQKQQKNAHVPKFGNWDNDGNVPYTLYFDNARKGKGGKPINPNDPVENPEAFSSSVVAPSPNRSFDQGRPALPPASPPPAHHHERRPSDAPAAAPPLSPPHPHSVTGTVPAAPVGQSRAEYSDGSGYGLVANSVDRSRARGASRGNEQGSAVPKFGDWDSNPASADGYTHIFNKVREEKSTQAKAPGLGKDNVAYGNGARKHDDGYVSSAKWHWEHRISLPYPDMTLPHNWHLDPERIVVPAAPLSMRAHMEEVWFAFEHEEARRHGIWDARMAPRRRSSSCATRSRSLIPTCGIIVSIIPSSHGTML